MTISPLLISYKETGVKNVTSGVSKMSPQEKAAAFGKGRDTTKWFARTALKSIVDDGLSDKAFRVFALIACGSWQTGSIELGFDEIAWAVGCKRRQSMRVIEELERTGYIQIGRRHNRRNVYRPVEEHPRESRRIESAKCARCSKPVKQVGKQGWCRGCVTEANLEIKISGAKAEIGEGATEEQIATYLHLRKITGPVRRVLRKMERAA